ncbi:hypothetical protein PBY51_019705 [Eleginops maclovinus]|uniref:Uncharacterized protein n=1 Tax=Eleginops maclovinus TaxID=56733 RepID=A0AAN7XT51_ELEMC|nr:hypothetical protein PBY51_019705 [Eleginops maclovinus]
MSGSGAAVRLHEFRDDGPTLTPKSSRVGRDVQGLYPGQLGRVHIAHSKDSGGRSPSLHVSPPDPPNGNFQQSFDLRTLRALSVLRPAVRPQTSYQEHFGLQSPLFPQ